MSARKGSALRGRILAVDDSSLTRDLLVAILEFAGFSVSGVDSGGAALDAVARENFDVIILDAQMPGMDGIDVGLALRSDRRTACVPIVMYTSLPEDVIRRRFSGYDACLQKPCNPGQLRRCIEDLVRAPRPADSENQSP